jgi:hypothetical protein
MKKQLAEKSLMEIKLNARISQMQKEIDGLKVNRVA